MNATTPRSTLTAPVFCERCEMVEPRLVADPHRCRLCGAVCCFVTPLASSQRSSHAAPLSRRTLLDAQAKMRRPRRLFYP